MQTFFPTESKHVVFLFFRKYLFLKNKFVKNYSFIGQFDFLQPDFATLC